MVNSWHKESLTFSGMGKRLEMGSVVQACDNKDILFGMIFHCADAAIVDVHVETFLKGQSQEKAEKDHNQSASTLNEGMRCTSPWRKK